MIPISAVICEVMRSRWNSTAFAWGVSALFLGCLASPALATDSPVTYKGTTANGGTVEFDVSADGAAVMRFQATQVPMTCGLSFNATANDASPVVGGAFSNGSPPIGLVFGGTFQADQMAEGTVSYRIVNVRYDGCSSETVSWTATARWGPPAPQDGEVEPSPSVSPRTLVSYRQEGGIAGDGPSLVVSKDRRARVSVGDCTARFKLKRGAWRAMRAAIRDARIRTIAGDYPPPDGAADMITFVVETRAGTVRIAPAAQPANEDVMRKLRPLLKVLNKTVAAGERRMAPYCRSAGKRSASVSSPTG